MSESFRVLGLLGLALLRASPVGGQWAPVGPGPHVFVLDLAGTPLDEFPSAVKALNGTMTVVDKNGQHMLRASSPSEFLITLPQVLPPDFTVEVDLIPKRCCNPEDFMLEGTPTMNRGAASAQLTWHPAHISAVGGGEMYQADMPADLAASTPGNLTQLVLEFSGTTVKLYTNGRRLYTLEKQFARGRVLRVWLGGQDEGLNAVYLAGLRILPGAVASALIAQAAGSGSAPPATPPTASQSQSVSGGSRVVPNVAVTQGSGGPLVTWGLLGGVTSYTVKRWKIDDLTCCDRTSPALNGPPWQDGALPVAGTYVFEVTATSPGWTATGQAQFVQFKSPGQIATVVPSGTVAPSSPAVSSGVTGVTSSGAAPANSAINKILPPPPRVVVLNGIAGAGASGSAPPKTIVLPTLAAAGAFWQVAPRTVSLSGITAAGPVITVRTPIGTSTPPIPVPRTIALAAISAAGGSSTPLPRTLSLSRLTGAGGFWVAPPRVLTLAGWTAAGIYP